MAGPDVPAGAGAPGSTRPLGTLSPLPGLSAAGQQGRSRSIGRLFPAVTPSPAPFTTSSGRQAAPAAAIRASSLTVGATQADGAAGRLIILAVVAGLGIAASAMWLALAGPGRRPARSVLRWFAPAAGKRFAPGNPRANRRRRRARSRPFT